MKVKELIEALQDLDPNLEVMIAGDGEGNGIVPYDGWCVGHYFQQEEEFYAEEDLADLEEEDENGEPLKVNAVVLFPL